MGNSKSLKQKLSENYDDDKQTSKMSTRFERSNLWSCLRKTHDGSHNKKIDWTEEPAIQEIYLREIVTGGNDCLLNTRRYLLKQLTSRICTIQTAKHYLKHVFDTAEQLRATGFDLSDKLLVNFMLLGLDCDFASMVKEIDSSKVKLTSEFVRWKILEHANKRYYCCFCKKYSDDILCPGKHPSRSHLVSIELRNGQKVNVFPNY